MGGFFCIQFFSGRDITIYSPRFKPWAIETKPIHNRFNGLHVESRFCIWNLFQEKMLQNEFLITIKKPPKRWLIN